MKTCKDKNCNNPVWSKGCCKFHTPKKPMKRTAIKRRKKKQPVLKHRTTKNKIEKNKELQTMLSIWKERSLIDETGREYCLCECTGARIYVFDRYHMAHIVSKGSMPSARTCKENIVIVKRSVHDLMDSGDKKSLPVEFLETIKERRIEIIRRFLE